jgi:hypothetical protein
MKMSDAFPSNYLRAADLNGSTVAVTIATVKMEDIGGDHKPVVYFSGKEKGLVLNKTNGQMIAYQYGDETDNWTGAQIELYPTMTSFQGKPVEAIRVNVRPPQQRQAPQRQSFASPPPPAAGQVYDERNPPPPDDNDIPF